MDLVSCGAKHTRALLALLALVLITAGDGDQTAHRADIGDETSQGEPELGETTPEADGLTFLDKSVLTSARCTSTQTHHDRQCTFQNLCYWPRHKTFVAVHGPDTVMDGLPEDRFTQAVADMSGVKGHNTMFFEFADVPQSTLLGRPIYMETGQHVIFRRFHPDNIMHVLHDDLLPLFHTLQAWDGDRQCSWAFSVREAQKALRVSTAKSQDDSCSRGGVESPLSCGEVNGPARSESEADKYSEDASQETGDANVTADQDLVALSPSCGWPKLVYVEGRSPGPWVEWLRALSGGRPLLSQQDMDERGADSMTCFEHAHIGLDKTPTWYQYGFFDNIQGPIDESNATGAHLRTFAKHMYTAFNVSIPGPVDMSIADRSTRPCLMSRLHNRLIVNEAEVVRFLSSKLSRTVDVVRIEDKEPREILDMLRSCELVVGMHGSALALAMFLPPGAGLLELFPYAVDSKLFSPYQTMASLPGSQLAYAAWENNDIERTRTYPDRSPDLGGLAHLDGEERRRIELSDHVEPRPCCSDPEWLYRIYQDTVVDLPSLEPVLDDLLAATTKLQDKIRSGQGLATHVLFPDRPQRVSCHFLKDKLELNIRWRPPWNIFFLLHHATLSLEEVASPEKWGAWYEVVVQGGGGPKYKPFQTQATEFLVDISDVAAKPEDIVVWVRVGTSKDSGKGPFSAAAHCT